MSQSLAVPIVELQPWFTNLTSCDTQAHGVATVVTNALRNFGAVIVQDPRVNLQDFVRPRDLLECYFAQPEHLLTSDMHPDWHYQVGLSPPGAETGRLDILDRCTHWAPEHQPHIPHGAYPGDPKLRFFIRLREAVARHANDHLNRQPVIPAAFQDIWQPTMNTWGEQLLRVGESVLEMIETALGIEPGKLRRVTDNAPHLLGPNAYRFTQNSTPGTIINLFHSDLNLLTIHGPANYPGLRIWLRNGTSFYVKIPPGHILVQVGQQLEWLTGGLMMAGFHEVVVTEEALQLSLERTCPWRISCPCFMHSSSSIVLEPFEEAFVYEQLAPEVKHERLKSYPAITAGEQVQRELYAIGLAKK